MKNLIYKTLFLFCCLQAYGQDYLQLANECFENGDYECAKRNFTLFQTFDGSDMSAQIQKSDECMRSLLIADEFFKDAEWEKARVRYQIVLEKNPKDAHAKKQFDLCEENLKVKPSGNENLPVLPVLIEKQPHNLRIKGGTTIRRSGLLFVAGEVCIAGGLVASILSTKTYPDGKEYNFIYAASGVVVGAVCIGSGIKLKKKEKNQSQNIDYSYNRSHSTSYCDNYSHLNLVVYGNEVGLRLTF